MGDIKVAAEQAYATIVTELAAPRFFEKLAAHGIGPRSESEAAEMWSLASKLHELYTAEQEKAAAAQVSSLTAANKQLDGVLAAAGLRGQVKQSSAYAGAANVAAAQPEIAQAVLMLQVAADAAMQNA